MIRRLFTILSVLSMLLCIGVAVLWVRSYFVSDRFYTWWNFEDAGRETFWTQDYLRIGRGGIGIHRAVISMGGPAIRSLVQHAHERYGRPPFHKTTAPEYPTFDSGVGGEAMLGFKARRASGQALYPGYSFEVVVPLWSIFILFFIPPSLWLWRWSAARRWIRAGHCPTCSYDLRAHKPGERCPECGTPIATSSRLSKAAVPYPRLVRRLATVLSALSLLLCAALLLKWAIVPGTPLALWRKCADAEPHIRFILFTNDQIVIGEWQNTPDADPDRVGGSLQRQLESLNSQLDWLQRRARVYQTSPDVLKDIQREIAQMQQMLNELPLTKELASPQQYGLRAGISPSLGRCFGRPTSAIPLIWRCAGMTYHRDFLDLPGFRISRKLYVRFAVPIWMISATLLIAPLWRAVAICITVVVTRGHLDQKLLGAI